MYLIFKGPSDPSAIRRELSTDEVYRVLVPGLLLGNRLVPVFNGVVELQVCT